MNNILLNNKSVAVNFYFAVQGCNSLYIFNSREGILFPVHGSRKLLAQSSLATQAIWLNLPDLR